MNYLYRVDAMKEVGSEGNKIQSVYSLCWLFLVEAEDLKQALKKASNMRYRFGEEKVKDVNILTVTKTSSYPDIVELKEGDEAQAIGIQY